MKKGLVRPRSLSVKSISLFALAFFALLAASPRDIRGAEQPEFLMTWNAQTYVPLGYRGKTLPSRESTIDVSLELITQGRLANLSKNEIRWFVNEGQYATGKGLKGFSFVVPRTATGNVRVKAAILDYQSTNIEKTILIPIAAPVVVIDMPSLFGNTIPLRETLVARALPYFFNTSDVKDLQFSWSANGIQPTGETENPDILNLDLAKATVGNRINLRVAVTNPSHELEVASDAMNLELR